MSKQHEWIIHELEDLARYARENRMRALAELLIEARTMAMLEVANHPTEETLDNSD